MGEHLEKDFADFGISRLLRGVGALRKRGGHLEKDFADFGIGHPLSGVGVLGKRGGPQIGGHLEKDFADFGIGRPLSGVGAPPGKAQILGASVDVQGGTSHMWGRCLILAHSMLWFGHTVQNRDAARDVWRAMLHISNGLRSDLQPAAVLTSIRSFCIYSPRWLRKSVQ